MDTTIILLAVLFAIFIILILIISYIISTYNTFKTLDNTIIATREQILVALKKRLDLISQLIEATKEYMKYEKETLTKITEIRMKLHKNKDLPNKEISEIDNRLSNLFGNISVQVEAYPDLKSSEEVLKLMDNIKEMETEIANLRYAYNNVVQEYNTLRSLFPSNIVANLFNFQIKDYLKFEETEKELNKRPTIKLN